MIRVGNHFYKLDQEARTGKKRGNTYLALPSTHSYLALGRRAASPLPTGGFVLNPYSGQRPTDGAGINCGIEGFYMW